MSSTVWCASMCRIAPGAHREVDQPVARELVEHVIEERHAGRELGAARAVEIHLDRDLRLRRCCARPRAVRAFGEWRMA